METSRMKLSDIAAVSSRYDQVCLLVINSQKTTAAEKRLAIKYYHNNYSNFVPVLSAARRTGLASIRLDEYSTSVKNPEAEPLATEFTPPDPAVIRQQFAAASPDTKAVIREMLATGMITGLRDVTIYSSKAEADAAWNAQPGYVELRPAMPPRSTPMNSNTSCRFSSICNWTDCSRCESQKN